jgi:hypothetical protein
LKTVCKPRIPSPKARSVPAALRLHIGLSFFPPDP